MKSEKPPKLGLIFIGRKRPGFDQEWGRQMEERVRLCLQKTNLEVFEPAEKTVDEESLRRTMDACHAAQVDAIVLLQTTMGDARLSQTLAQRWPDPVVLWATPEKPDGDMISSCSLVGAHCWASVFRQMGHSFEVVYGDPDAPETSRRLTEAVRMAATVRRLRSVRLGLIGGQAPGYFAMSADPFTVRRGLGAQVQSFSLLEFANVVNGLSEQVVSEDVARLKALGLPLKDVTAEELPMASRIYLAMHAFFETENLDAMTIRCWPEMANTFGQWPYLGVARLTDEGHALAIEGDADAALSAWIVENLELGRCYLSDWLDHDRETITLWHGGAAPMSLCEPVGSPGGPTIARHFNIKKPAVVEATLRAEMPVTLFRFWRLEGKYFLTAREGETLRPKRHLMATNGLARMREDPREWFEELCHQGMPHHIAVVRGHHAALLKRFGRALDMQFV